MFVLFRIQHLLHVGETSRSAPGCIPDRKIQRTRLDPLSLTATANITWRHSFAHEYDQAIARCQEVLQMDSTCRGERRGLNAR